MLPILLAAILLSDVTVTDIDDRVHTARSVEFIRGEKGLTVTFKGIDGIERSMPAEDIIQIQFTDVEPSGPFKPQDIRFVFTNGDHISGRILDPGEAPDTLRIHTGPLGILDLEFENATRIEFLSNRNRIRSDLENAVGRDIILRKNGDRPRGYLLSLNPERITFADLDNPDVTFSPAPSELAAVYLAKRRSPHDPSELFSIVTLRDGSRLRGNIEKAGSGRIEFTTLYGLKLGIPLAALAGIHFRNGRVVYLSDLEPAHTDENPNYIRGLQPSPSDLVFPVQTDRSVKGTAMSIRGRGFTKGLGVHARSILEFDLGGGFKQFRATIGIDDVAGGIGDVVFQVHVDGKKVFESGPVTGEAPARDIEVDVTGASTLQLHVGFGRQGNTGDCADWGMARLTR